MGAGEASTTTPNGRALLLRGGVLGLLGVSTMLALGCRQPNPDWLGPTTSGDSDSGDSTIPPDSTGGQSDSTGPVPSPTDSGVGPMCSGDEECSEPTPLCLDEMCVASAEGQPCSSDAQCDPSAPICNQNGQCQDGSEGDPCGGNGPDDCSDAASHCAMDGKCYDGSPGDPCNAAPHCMSGTCDGGMCT